jgi:S1-C subfamily serine protease
MVRTSAACHIEVMQPAERTMPDTPDLLSQVSERFADLAEQSGAEVVAVAGGSRWPVSGIHWRPGVIVSAEEALERDDGIEVMTADGKVRSATLAGRDPSTDIAVLRFQPASRRWAMRRACEPAILCLPSAGISAGRSPRPAWSRSPVALGTAGAAAPSII